MQASANGKLSFVLPVTFMEKGSSLDGGASWRRSPDEGAKLRTRLLLASFLKNFRQDDLRAFYLVCPARDMPALSEILAPLTRDPRYRIVDELGACPDLAHPESGPIEGWYAQQLIKLAMAGVVASGHYVTLDSDILCVKPFGHDSLVRDGLALTNVETLADYERIYTPAFCRIETAVKLNRYLASAGLLGYRRPAESSLVFHGETPVVLHAESVIAMTEHLGERFRKPWCRVLAGRPGWTEQTLYFQFLEMTGRLASVCALAGCNAVLDLEKSVWQASRNYRLPRAYDAAHFTAQREDGAGGCFVAVQSWLPVTSWLPPRCLRLRDFHDEVEAWLLS